jgi:hypothetical protein
MAATDEEKVEGVSPSPEASDSENAAVMINEKSLLRKIDAHLLPAVG